MPNSQMHCCLRKPLPEGKYGDCHCKESGSLSTALTYGLTSDKGSDIFSKLSAASPHQIKHIRSGSRLRGGAFLIIVGQAAKSMSTLSATISEEYMQRYAALLRATNAIGTCSDCDTAADVLIDALREVTTFDYLQLVTFESDTETVSWHLLYSNGARQALHPADVIVQGTPIAWVHQSQQALITADWNEETRFANHAQFLNELGIAATCVLPLARGERRLGALSVGRSRPGGYPEDEVHFLSIVADQIALAIDAAVNFYLSQQSQDRLKLILDLTNQVVSKLNFQELLQAISASVRRVMGCDAAAIMLPEPDGQHLRKHALDFPDSKGLFTEDNLIPIEGSEIGDTFRSGKPWVMNRLDPAQSVA